MGSLWLLVVNACGFVTAGEFGAKGTRLYWISLPDLPLGAKRTLLFNTKYL